MTEMWNAFDTGTKALLITAWVNGPRKARYETWKSTQSLSLKGQLRGSLASSVRDFVRMYLESECAIHDVCT